MEPKCGHTLATCHDDVCLQARPKVDLPEIAAEAKRRVAEDHARAMYHMAVQQAEAELDHELERVENDYQAELARIRHDRHHKAEECTCAAITR
jgi:hypothetical protein